ncbi:MAG TPA: hypothetical protein VI056_11745 [Candidatus Limnocylindria bacterium]
MPAQQGLKVGPAIEAHRLTTRRLGWQIPCRDLAIHDLKTEPLRLLE